MTSDYKPAAEKKGQAAARYSHGTIDRQPFLDRARRCSALTIPSLFRQQGENGSTSYQVPWSSLGAEGVNSLTSKEIIGMFPPGLSFIKTKPGDKQALDLDAIPDPDKRGKLKAVIDQALAKREVTFIECIEEDGDRPVLYDAKQHMIVGGNHCIKVLPKTSKLQSIPLQRYVTWRSDEGDLQEFVIQSFKPWRGLDADIKDICKAQGYQLPPDERHPPPGGAVYTHGVRTTDQWDIYQEVWSEEVPGSRHTLNDDALNYLFLREKALENEHYGRSYCEDYEGDLQLYDAFWQILFEGAAASAILKWLVKAGGTTSKAAFERLPNGGVMTGSVDDVAAVRADKGGDLAFAVQLAEKIEQRLERVFLMYSSIQRNGERVTREEIVTLRADLEQTLGAVYANQVTTFQAPYARLKMAAVERQGRIAKLPKDSVKVTILTGEAGIGRSAQAQELDTFVGRVATSSQVQSPYLNISTYLARQAANQQIDPDGLINSEEKVQQTQLQAQQAQLTTQVAPEVVKQGGQMLQNQQQQDAQPADQAAA